MCDLCDLCFDTLGLRGRDWGRGEPLGSADNGPGSPHGMTAVLQCCMQLLKASCPGHYLLHGEQFLVDNNYLRVPETSSKLDV